jgi:hypothetical protein
MARSISALRTRDRYYAGDRTGESAEARSSFARRYRQRRYRGWTESASSRFFRLASARHVSQSFHPRRTPDGVSRFPHFAHFGWGDSGMDATPSAQALLVPDGPGPLPAGTPRFRSGRHSGTGSVFAPGRSSLRVGLRPGRPPLRVGPRSGSVPAPGRFPLRGAGRRRRTPCRANPTRRSKTVLGADPSGSST